MFLPSCMYLDGLAMFNRIHLFKLLFFLYSITFLDSSESNGNGRVCNWVMNNCTGWLFAMIKKRLSLQAVKMQELDGSNQYLFVVHPHGILPIGGFSVFVAKNLDGSEFATLFPTIRSVRLLAASFCFLLPVFRELLLVAGFIDASKESCRKAIAKGHSLAVCPGGASEALLANDETRDKLFLSKRKGFIRMAIQYGLHVVPVFSFNEASEFRCVRPDEKSFLHSSLIKQVRSKVQGIIGWSVPLVRHFLPKPTSVTVAYGPSIYLGHSENPSDEQIEQAMSQYTKALEELYNKYGSIYNEPKDKTLVIL